MKPEPISAKLANGDSAKGAAFFAANCAPCHVVRAQDVATIGPNLWNVVGRDKASTEFDRYSKSSWLGRVHGRTRTSTFFSPGLLSQRRA